MNQNINLVEPKIGDLIKLTDYKCLDGLRSWEAIQIVSQPYLTIEDYLPINLSDVNSTVYEIYVEEFPNINFGIYYKILNKETMLLDRALSNSDNNPPIDKQIDIKGWKEEVINLLETKTGWGKIVLSDSLDKMMLSIMSDGFRFKSECFIVLFAFRTRFSSKANMGKNQLIDLLKDVILDYLESKY